MGRWADLRWINRFRRLTIRYKRCADIHLAFTFASALFCHNQIRRFRQVRLVFAGSGDGIAIGFGLGIATHPA
ncbi:hypothetical protein F0Q34_11890 [Pseudoroseomonas oryzae]|uniref:Uncharacterized protein n=1 Tax=Teichococcus oryzae TaxID=1608942 RepID=A0A5B2TF83_9PROT|nr:hypothetical protein F0Q34_11890 [Pseudoroseomonas oryzae]